jgi:hypothetical protein
MNVRVDDRGGSPEARPAVPSASTGGTRVDPALIDGYLTVDPAVDAEAQRVSQFGELLDGVGLEEFRRPFR